MAQRKLQQEIDKCFKKVSEGVTAFEGIFEKIQQTTNPSQKEKLEDNLKREIKKLQRHRDQIKTWAAGNEIKDKKPLLEQRKLIEAEMEKFKAVEKEMKTKAFSKEGLSAAAKLDPKEKEKLEGCQFLSEMVEELERQIETLEAEEEQLQATKKGKKDSSKAERLSEIARATERHKWHQGQLEKLLRSLENGNVDVETLNQQKDGIRYYVDENQTVEFMEDETLYDDFNLDDDENAWGMSNEIDKVSSQDTQSVQGETDMSETRSSSSKQKPSSTEPPAAAARRPSNQLKSPLPALATLHNPTASSSSGALPSNMKPAPPPTRAPGETLKYASAAAAAASSDKSGIAPLPPPPGAASVSPLPPAARGLASMSNGPKPGQAPSEASSSQAGGPKSPSGSHANTSSFPPTPALEKSEPTSNSKGKQPLSSMREAPEDSPEPEQPKTPPGLGNNGVNGTSQAANNGTDDNVESIYHLPTELQELVQSYEASKARSPWDNAPGIGQTMTTATQQQLAASHQNCQEAAESDKPFHYRPQNKYHTPRYYPQEPSAIVDDPALYERLDTDTLFYVFYYRQGTYQQYLAAKSLKGQSWRFHKQYQTWFQRHEEPKTITEEYEQGTYRFFDYESTWMNRRKADFKFAYKYLEDDL